jgi:hypothetical protein
MRKLIVAALLVISLIPAYANTPSRKDPHRPPCTSQECRAIQQYLKAHYCGRSPWGNGEGESCELRVPKAATRGFKTLASYHCDPEDTSRSYRCAQRGTVPAAVVEAMHGQLTAIGVPAAAQRGIYYSIYQPSSAPWKLVEATYLRYKGDILTECQVLAVLGTDSVPHVLHKASCTKNDVDKPVFTEWSLLDVADVNVDGRVEIILEGNAYEDHWLEVIRLREDLTPEIIYSGLGYWL